MKLLGKYEISTKSLGVKFSLVVVVITIVGMSLAAFILYTMQKDTLDGIVAKEKVRLEAKGDQLLNFMSNIAAEAINNYDFDSLGKYSEEAIKDKEISKVSYIDADGGSIAEATSKSFSKKDKALKQGITYEGNTLGTAFIYLSDTAIKKEIDRIEEENTKTLRGFLVALVIIVIIEVVFLFLGMSITFKKLVSERLREMVGNFKVIGEGDLTHKVILKHDSVDSYDEIDEVMNSYNLFVNQLTTMLKEIMSTVTVLSSSAEEMSASTREMASSTGAISKGIEVQASAAQESSSSMMTMDKSTNEISGKAKELSTLYSSTEGQVNNGEKSLDNVIQNITQIEDGSKKIEQIISLISDIASKTNLLALNAAIEAAKAGEGGKGFAVVADEVRKLAERSAESTKEISTIISNNTRTIQDGVKLAEATRKSFTEIMEGISSTSSFIAEIAQITDGQITTSSQVTKAIEELAATSENNATVVQQMTSSTDEIASASGQLSKMAENLNMLVSQFKVE